MKENYTSPVAETVNYVPEEPVAGISLNFGDFFGKSISNELSLKEGNVNSNT